MPNRVIIVMVFVKTLWRHGCFGFWAGFGGGAQGGRGIRREVHLHLVSKYTRMKFVPNSTFFSH